MSANGSSAIRHPARTRSVPQPSPHRIRSSASRCPMLDERGSILAFDNVDELGIGVEISHAGNKANNANSACETAGGVKPIVHERQSRDRCATAIVRAGA